MIGDSSVVGLVALAQIVVIKSLGKIANCVIDVSVFLSVAEVFVHTEGNVVRWGIDVSTF